MVSMCILALSSLSTNSRFVGILFTALIFFSDAVYGVLRGVTGGTIAVVGGVRQQPRAGRRFHFPRPAPL